MVKRNYSRQRLTAPWLAYTDLLSSTLLILSVVVVASLLAQLTNEKPPIIKLSDAKDYRFDKGSFAINALFEKNLIANELPTIERAIKCYAIDTVEIIGHTDDSPNSSPSNLDAFPAYSSVTNNFSKLRAGSNSDLGLLRALAVQKLLQKALGSSSSLNYRSYSASSLIDPEDMPLKGNLGKEKRRIEIRLTREKNAGFISKC